jgi:hypothetical protein
MDVLLVVLLLAPTNPLPVPMSTRNSASLVIVRRCRKEDRILKINIAGAKC